MPMMVSEPVGLSQAAKGVKVAIVRAWTDAQTRKRRDHHQGISKLPPRLHRDTTEPAESDRPVT